MSLFYANIPFPVLTFSSENGRTLKVNDPGTCKIARKVVDTTCVFHSSNFKKFQKMRPAREQCEP